MILECPVCGYIADGMLGVHAGDNQPKPGDPALCLNCATINVFTADGLRPAPPEVVAHVLTDPIAVGLVAHIRARGVLR